MSRFSAPVSVDTWNGCATAYVKQTDSDKDISGGLMDDSLKLSLCGDCINILGVATDGLYFHVGYIEFASDETRHNYLVDFSA